MTFLVVDVGNTSTALGVWRDGRVRDVAHCDGGFDEASAAAEARVARCRPSALAYVSVVPKLDAAWRRLAKRLGLAFFAVSHQAFADRRRTDFLRLDYPRPETIGADRLADAAGAVSRYGAPVLVMDFGTALTAAVVTADRIWRGGVIAPGLPLMRDYLFERTAKLPRMDLKCAHVPKIGRSTEAAMRFGALVGYRGMVREIVATLKRNFKTDFRLVATGGFAGYVLRGLDLDVTLDPTLTLYGTGFLAAQALSPQKQKGCAR